VVNQKKHESVQMTTKEKRLNRIAQLKARLQKEEAKLKTSQRKERTGQLVSWGVMVEEIFKGTDEAGRQRLIESAQKHLKDRNLERALAGFSRLAGEVSETKKSEPDLPNEEI